MENTAKKQPVAEDKTRGIYITENNDNKQDTKEEIEKEVAKEIGRRYNAMSQMSEEGRIE